MADLKQNINKGQVIGEYVGELVSAGKYLFREDDYLLTGYRNAYQVTSKEKGMISSVSPDFQRLLISCTYRKLDPVCEPCVPVELRYHPSPLAGKNARHVQDEPENQNI